jgi:DNA replication protein DnaC
MSVKELRPLRGLAVARSLTDISLRLLFSYGGRGPPGLVIRAPQFDGTGQVVATLAPSPARGNGASSMNNQQTLQSLRSLKLAGMADAFIRQLEHPQTQQLSFDERFALLVDSELTHRQNRRLQRLLNIARLRHKACVEEIDYQSKRGLNRSQVVSLINCEWIRMGQNLHITGPTGTGKSWLACAFGNAACRHGLTVRYERTSRLLEELRIARTDGSYKKAFRALARLDLLILDDFGLKPMSQAERHDLLELIEDRHELRSTLITSQLKISLWHSFIGEPTVADAFLDRILSNAHRLELELIGGSLRKSRKG